MSIIKSLPLEKNHINGLELKSILRGHSDVINRLSWSPDGTLLATPSNDGTIKIWNIYKDELISSVHFSGSVRNAAWSPNSKHIATVDNYNFMQIFDIKTFKIFKSFQLENYSVCIEWFSDSLIASGNEIGEFDVYDLSFSSKVGGKHNHSDQIFHIGKSADKTFLFSSSRDGAIKINNLITKETKLLLNIKNAAIFSSISNNKKLLASAHSDGIVRIWNLDNSNKNNIFLKGHTNAVRAVTFSHDDLLLASQSSDGTIRIWSCLNWETIAIIRYTPSNKWPPIISFHPFSNILVTLDENDAVIKIWHYNYKKLINNESIEEVVHYTNAKIVLVGETGTGKTCLARALMNKKFQPQESTHGMRIWNFLSEKYKDENGINITREVYLWDLAGQTDYQVVHQLFLDETSIGLVIFDPSHPDKPFSGVNHWKNALNKTSIKNCIKLLVAGRVDRGHPAVISKDINEYINKNEFHRYIATSSKTDEGIDELKSAIKELIPWDSLTETTSPEIWNNITDFLMEKRRSNIVLMRKASILESFKSKNRNKSIESSEFNIVIKHAQAQGLIWPLSFGDLVLLTPELLNHYSSAIVRKARKHPDGIGAVREREILDAAMDFEDMHRLDNIEIERSLLHAVVELLLQKEVAVREGEYIVLPSKFNRELPEYPEIKSREVSYSFTGAIEEIYATLTVRLYYSTAFELKDLWKNAAEFKDLTGRICGYKLNLLGEGKATLSIFFSEFTSIDTKLLFLKFIHLHLISHADPEFVTRNRIYHCVKCKEEVENKKAIQKRLEEGKEDIICQYCDTKIPLLDLLEEKFGDQKLISKVKALDKEINRKKNYEVGITTSLAKNGIGEFDVFLAHNSKNKQEVLKLSELLKKRGINPWIDQEQIAPGKWFQDVIQQAIPNVKSAAIIIGNSGVGRWEKVELKTFISQCVDKNIPIIPILLPTVHKIPDDLLFLKEYSLVDFVNTVEEEDSLDNLEWGITGIHPKRKKELNL